MISESAELLVKRILETVIQRYRLAVVAPDDSEVFLVGSDFALWFAFDREGITAAYLDIRVDQSVSAYTLRPLTLSRFTPSDREVYGNPQTPRDVIVASLNVYAIGLIRHCDDVLSGDKSWLRRDDWKTVPPGEPSLRVLRRYLIERNLC
jgi:hypothetical protein